MKNFSTTPLKRRNTNPRFSKKTRRMATEAVEQKILDFHILLTRATSEWLFTPEQKRQYRALTGMGAIFKWPLLSDLRARRKASRFLIRLMARHWRQRPKTPERRYFFLTFIDDLGNTSDRTPQVNLPAIQRKADKAMRVIGLHGVGVIEVQALMNYPGRGHGRTLLFHAHAIAWTTDPQFKFKAAEARINGSPSWSNSFGAKPCKILPMTDEEGQIDWLAYYILKVPYDAKNRMPDHKHPGRHILMQTTKGYRPELALRVFEGLTHFDLPEVLFGVGEGTAIRSRWRTKLLTWHRARSAEQQPECPFDVEAFWNNVRGVNGSKNFAPYQILAGRARPASVHPGINPDK